jgi:thioredoxin-like negative regulator of GroEL
LGHRTQRQGDFDTADRAYAVASEADPKNALILWDRAQNKAQSGDAAGANRLLKQIADTPWDGQYQNTRANALRQLGR